MAEFCQGRSRDTAWLANGGIDTLQSYGIRQQDIALYLDSPRRHAQLIEAVIPPEHLRFIAGLPILLSVPGYLFVHAGLRPGTSIPEQEDEDLLWIRGEFLQGEQDFGVTIVHGHTPVPAALVSPRRISLDTGAFATGILSSARIVPDDRVTILKVQ